MAGRLGELPNSRSVDNYRFDVGGYQKNVSSLNGEADGTCTSKGLPCLLIYSCLSSVYNNSAKTRKNWRPVLSSAAGFLAPFPATGVTVPLYRVGHWLILRRIKGLACPLASCRSVYLHNGDRRGGTREHGLSLDWKHGRCQLSLCPLRLERETERVAHMATASACLASSPACLFPSFLHELKRPRSIVLRTAC
jgi:hypothetical protein